MISSNSNHNNKKIYLLSEADSLLKQNNIKIILRELGKAKGYTYLSNITNKYYIIINESLSEDMQLATLLHELKHIQLGHLECFLEDRDKCEEIIKKLNL